MFSSFRLQECVLQIIWSILAHVKETFIWLKCFRKYSAAVRIIYHMHSAMFGKLAAGAMKINAALDFCQMTGYVTA